MKARTDWGAEPVRVLGSVREDAIRAEMSGFGYAAMASATLASIPLRVIFE